MTILKSATFILKNAKKKEIKYYSFNASPGVAYLTFVNVPAKIFSVFYLNTIRLFVKIVMKRNIMVRFDDPTDHLTPFANVGNLVFVLLIVVNDIIKPSGALMV